MVVAATSTLDTIKTKVRRLTASSDTSQLTEAELEQAINVFYSADFPYAIKMDQTQVTYEIFTKPNIDRYPLNIQRYQGIRDPVYFEGVQGGLYKERGAFFSIWPRFPTKITPATGDGVTVAFTFTVAPIPFLSNNVVIGTANASGTAIRIEDNGVGGLNLVTTDSLGDNTFTNVGTVNYITGAFSITFPVAPGADEDITVWVSSYSAARPYTILFFNNEFTVRPVPDNVYKIELMAYQTPAQLLDSNTSPVIEQWAQYIAYGAAVELLRERQDMEGVENLMEGFMRQERLVLERQATEEIGQQNATIYNRRGPGSNYYSGSW